MHGTKTPLDGPRVCALSAALAAAVVIGLSWTLPEPTWQSAFEQLRRKPCLGLSDQCSTPRAIFDPPTVDGGSFVTPTPPRNRAYHPIFTPPPRYPRDQLRALVEGTVILRITITPEGQLQSVAIVATSGSAGLDEAARRHVTDTWQLAPEIRDGHAVKTIIDVPIRYSLN